MRRLIFLIFISILVYGCNKDEPQDPVYEQEISFNVTVVETGLKDIICYVDYVGNIIEPDYAHVVINDIDYFPLVYRIDGVLYTQNIKLSYPPGIYDVSVFELWWDGDTPGGILPEPDDVLLMATPELSSEYAQYVNKPVKFDITVQAFDKIEVDVEVLCYQEDQYTEFGFDWFVVSELVIREQCFFGDICVKHPQDYDGSNYMYQPNGLQMDMPAIMQLRLFRSPNGQAWPIDPQEIFTNDAGPDYGAGAPLCIQYVDDIGKEDYYRLELWILVKWGDTFIYKWFYDWYFMDEDVIPDGADGIVDFVLGECNLIGTDLQLPPYQDLPTYANLSIDFPGDPGFWDIIVNTMDPPGTYDLVLGGPQLGFCADAGAYIGTWPYPYTLDAWVYTSLYDHDWPSSMPWELNDIAQVNWLMNNLDLWGFDILNLTAPQGIIIQDAVWNILSDEANGGTAGDMSAAAASHGNFVPLPGGWAAVILIEDNQPQTNQVLITVVDP